MTDKTDSKERADFEAWYRTTNWPSDLGCYEGRYMSNIADASWQAWHARASLAASAGSEPVANDRPSLEAVFRGLSDRAYCNYIEQMRRNECLGWEHKVKHGTFGEAELKAHTQAGRLLGRHHAFAEAANALRGSDASLTHPSPPEGMVGGWRQPLIARALDEWHEDDGPVMWWAWCGRDWAGEPAWCGTPLSSDWPGYHTHWTAHPSMPLPPPPTTSAGSGKG